LLHAGKMHRAIVSSTADMAMAQRPLRRWGSEQPGNRLARLDALSGGKA